MTICQVWFKESSKRMSYLLPRQQLATTYLLSTPPYTLHTPAFKYRFRETSVHVCLSPLCMQILLCCQQSTWLLSWEYGPLTGVCKSWSRFPFAPSFSLGPRLARFISEGKAKVLENNFLLVIGGERQVNVWEGRGGGHRSIILTRCVKSFPGFKNVSPDT